MTNQIDKEVIERLAKEYCNGMSQQATIMQYHFRVETLSDLATALLAHVQDAELTKTQEAVAYCIANLDGTLDTTIQPSWNIKDFEKHWGVMGQCLTGLYTAPPNIEALKKDAERLETLMTMSGEMYQESIKHQFVGRLREFIDANSAEVNEALAKDKQ